MTQEVFVPQHIDEIDTSDVEKLIGQELEQPEWFNYDVTRDTIRHFAYGINDYNALYMDEGFASKTRFGGIIAPPGYLYSHGHAVWARILGDIPGITQNDNAGEQWEFFIPIRPGDRVVANVKIHDVQKRQGRRAGPLVIVFSDMTFTNQRNEVVARDIGSSFRFSTRGVIQRGGMAQAVVEASEGKLREISPVPDFSLGVSPVHPPGTRRYDTHNVYWDDVNVGDEIPPNDIGILHPAHLKRYTAGTRGGFPTWFVTPEQAAAWGPGHPIPSQFAPGVMRTPWFGTMLTQWAGPNVWVSKISYESREWNLVGYGVINRGRVTGKRMENGKFLVDLDVWTENEFGMVTNPGQAIVELLPNEIQPGTGLG